jgi:aminoglycoside phosphotransferase (APT) family kinase protein
VNETTIEAALTALAPALTAGASSAAELTRLTGGASMETWRFSLTGAPGTFILRRRAFASQNALPLATEAMLLRAACGAGVKVPHVVRVCAPEDGLGEALIVAHVAGETLGRRIVAGTAFEGIRPLLARQAGEALARIHSVIPPALPGLPVLDAAAKLAQYEAIYRGTGACRPVLEWAFRVLERDLPMPVPPRLVHGDFRTGNLIVDPACGLAAVLDWELSHFGDPAEDLGWLCVNSWRFGAVDQPAGGFGSIADIVAGYEAAGGVAPAFSRVRYWQMLGSLKWAVMCLMMFASHAGDASPLERPLERPFERPLERTVIGRRVSECEVDLLAMMAGAV